MGDDPVKIAGPILAVMLMTGCGSTPQRERDALFRDCIHSGSDPNACVEAIDRLKPAEDRP